MIPKAIIKRKYKSKADENGKRTTPKDVNRFPNITKRLSHYILEHNESLPEISSERYLWFSDSLGNLQRQKRAKNINRVKLGKHIEPEWLNGSITFNMCQIEHGKELEEFIEEINSVPIMAVFAQTERSWAIRRMMENIFINRRRTYLKKMKVEVEESGDFQQSTTQEQKSTTENIDSSTSALLKVVPMNEKNGEISLSPENALPHYILDPAVHMTEDEAVVASKRAFEELQSKPEAQELSRSSKMSSNLENSAGNVSDIDKQIAHLKKKKRRMQRKNNRKENSDWTNSDVGTDHSKPRKTSKRSKKSQ